MPGAWTEPSTCEHTICIAYHGWPGDVERLVGALLGAGAAAHPQLEVVLGAGSRPELPREVMAMRSPSLARPPLLVRVSRDLGHAELLNIAARRARGEIVHFVEPSLEFGADVLAAARSVLEDPGVGACGPFGLVTSDWREFEATEEHEVTALEYMVSVRRADIPRVGEMDTRFRYYRNLDIDYSLQVAGAGMRLWRYDAAVTRHAHRLWEATDPAERERLSRRNFNRLLDRWVRPGAPSS